MLLLHTRKESKVTTKLTIDADTSWLDAFKAERGSTHMLAMSRGKDALACWVVMLEHGFEVIPYHMDLIPGLSFVDESIAQLEQRFGTKIYRIPHPSLFRMLDNLVFQTPDRIELINQLDPKVPTWEEIHHDIRKQSGAPKEAMVGSGVRACDSPLRRMTFQKYGHIRAKQNTFFPVWNFRKADVMSLLARHNVTLPVEYSWFNRSFDGIDARFLVPIKLNRPDDYRKILEWFPLAELEVYRHGLANS